MLGPRARAQIEDEGARNISISGNGVSGGAMYGSSAGPAGAIAGSMLGGAAGLAFSSRQHSGAKYKAEIEHIMREAEVSRDMAEYVRKNCNLTRTNTAWNGVMR